MATRREQEKKKIRYSSAKARVEKHETGFQPTAFTVPDGMKLFRFRKVGNYRVDIIPYIVGDGNIYADGGKGSVYYERTYFVHPGIGPENKSYCCVRKTYGKKCAVCDYSNKIRLNPETDKDLLDQLKPKERQLFLFLVHDERDEGPQLFETAHYKSFGELLDDKIDATDDDEEHLRNFFRLDSGMSLKVTVKEDTFQGRKYLKPTNIEFIPRPKPLDESLLDDMPCLDDLPVQQDYNDLKALFLQQSEDEDSDEDEEEPKSRKTSSRAEKNGEKDEDEEEPEEDESEDEDEDSDDDEVDEDAIKVGSYVTHKKLKKCKVIHVSPDGSSLRLLDGKGKIHKTIDMEECELVEEDPTPTKSRNNKSGSAASVGKKTASAKSPSDEDDDDEDWDKDEDDSSDEDESEEEEEPEEEDSDDDEDWGEDEKPTPAKKKGKK